MRQEPAGDGGVIVKHFALGDFQFREENFAEIGEMDFAAVNVQIAFVAVGDERR